MSNKAAVLIKRALYEQGTSLRAWANEHGYAYSTVLAAVDRHAGDRPSEPWGPKTRAILYDLGRTIDKQLIA